MKIVPLKYDFCIKEIMENEIVRTHFISDVLDIPIEDIKTVRMMNTFLWRRFRRQKQGILDIQLELNDSTKINIEMQMEQKAHWKMRTVFYLAKMFTADLRRGEAYKKAKKCIAITILDFDLDKRVQYHNVYTLRDKLGNIYTDILELHTIELKKQPNQAQPSPLDEWHRLFNAKTQEDLDMIKSKTGNIGIMEAIKELKEISVTDRIRLEYEYRLKAKRDREAEDEFVFEEGKAQGLEQGIEKGIKSLIHSMRAIDAADEQVIAALMTEYHLSREEAQGKIQSF